MVWFVVDDKFHASEEVLSLPREHRAAAIGLWTLAGAWSSDHLKDGFVPMYLLDQVAGSVELAELLVKPANLWSRKGKLGYQFRNWDKWQKMRSDVEDKRKAERDRKAAYRANRQQNTGSSPAFVPRDTDGFPDTPTLTQPNPTQPPKKLDQTEIDFAEWWALYPKKVAKPDSLKAYKAVRKTQSAETLLKGLQAYLLMTVGKDREFIKNPAGWLRAGRWGDEYSEAVETKSGIVTGATCRHEYPVGDCPYCESQPF